MLLIDRLIIYSLRIQIKYQVYFNREEIAESEAFTGYSVLPVKTNPN